MAGDTKKDIKVSAIVCTYNRSGYLKACIEGLLRQTLLRGLFEIIVVDNGSTDDTRAVCGSFKEGDLVYVHEPKRGLSNARNTGLDVARGGYVAYIDDDAVADERWLERILNAFISVRPSPAAVGGRIYLNWEKGRPGWFPPEVLGYLGYLDYGDKPFFIKDGNKDLFGGNMAFDASALRECGGFSAGLGRGSSGGLLSNEEIELFKRLKRKGRLIYYEPEAVVFHAVPEERTTEGFIYKRGLWQGVSDISMLWAEKAFCRAFLRIPVSMVKYALISTYAAFIRQKRKQVFIKSVLCYHKGYAFLGVKRIISGKGDLRHGE
jgi:glycosyltransferase involved in cell wall biosynthesis